MPTIADIDEAASEADGGPHAVRKESAEDNQTSNFFVPTAAVVNPADITSERPLSSSTTASLFEIYVTLQSNLTQLKEVNKKLHGLQERKTN